MFGLVVMDSCNDGHMVVSRIGARVCNGNNIQW